MLQASSLGRPAHPPGCVECQNGDAQPGLAGRGAPLRGSPEGGNSRRQATLVLLCTAAPPECLAAETLTHKQDWRVEEHLFIAAQKVLAAACFVPKPLCTVVKAWQQQRAGLVTSVTASHLRPGLLTLAAQVCWNSAKVQLD